jgi:hypothetical protein
MTMTMIALTRNIFDFGLQISDTDNESLNSVQYLSVCEKVINLYCPGKQKNAFEAA